MKDKKRIVIAEDHTIVRNGLKALLSQENDFKIREYHLYFLDTFKK